MYQLRGAVRIAPATTSTPEAITAHSEPPVIVALARLLALQQCYPHLIVSGPTAAWPGARHGTSTHSTSPFVSTSKCPIPPGDPPTTPYPGGHGAHTPPRGGRSPAMNRYDGDIMGATLEDTIIDCAALDREEVFVNACAA